MDEVAEPAQNREAAIGGNGVRRNRTPVYRPRNGSLDFQSWSPTDFLEFVAQALNGSDDTIEAIRQMNLDGDFIGHIVQEPVDAPAIIPIPQEDYAKLRDCANAVVAAYERSSRQHLELYEQDRRNRRRVRGGEVDDVEAIEEMRAAGRERERQRVEEQHAQNAPLREPPRAPNVRILPPLQHQAGDDEAWAAYRGPWMEDEDDGEQVAEARHLDPDFLRYAEGRESFFERLQRDSLQRIRRERMALRRERIALADQRTDAFLRAGFVRFAAFMQEEDIEGDVFRLPEIVFDRTLPVVERRRRLEQRWGERRLARLRAAASIRRERNALNEERAEADRRWGLPIPNEADEVRNADGEVRIQGVDGPHNGDELAEQRQEGERVAAQLDREIESLVRYREYALTRFRAHLEEPRRRMVEFRQRLGDYDNDIVVNMVPELREEVERVEYERVNAELHYQYRGRQFTEGADRVVRELEELFDDQRNRLNVWRERAQLLWRLNRAAQEEVKREQDREFWAWLHRFATRLHEARESVDQMGRVLEEARGRVERSREACENVRNEQQRRMAEVNAERAR